MRGELQRKSDRLYKPTLVPRGTMTRERVCVCERERGGEREREGERERGWVGEWSEGERVRETRKRCPMW